MLGHKVTYSYVDPTSGVVIEQERTLEDPEDLKAFMELLSFLSVEFQPKQIAKTFNRSVEKVGKSYQKRQDAIRAAWAEYRKAVSA